MSRLTARVTTRGGIHALATAARRDARQGNLVVAGEGVLRRAATTYSCELWVDAADIAQPDGTDVETWPARHGTAPTQATPGKRPVIDRVAGSLEFGGVDDAYLTAVDLDGAEGASVYVVARLDSTAATAVLFEYSNRYDTQDALVCGVDSSARFWTGMGPTGSRLSYRNSVRTVDAGEPQVFAARYDRSPSPDVLTQHVTDDGEVVENTVFGAEKLGNAVTPFGSYPSWLGARNNGAERQLLGGMYEVLVVPAYVPDDAHRMIIYALAVKGGLL